MCVCPLGQKLQPPQQQQGGIIACVPCDQNTYNEIEGSNICLPCPPGYVTENKGSVSKTDCHEDPEKKRQREKAKLVETVSIVVVVAVVIIIVLLIVAVRQYYHGYQAQLELTAMKQEELERQRQELAFEKDWRVNPDDLSYDEKLATGAEGQVWRGSWRHGQKRQTVAIKRVMPGADETGRPKSSAVWDEREVAFMMAIQHPRVVRLLGAGEVADELSLGEPALLLVQEFMSGGSIDRVLWNSEPTSLPWDVKLTWASDIAEGMAYIHLRGFSHRDLKSPNVLFDKTSMRAKVADFGMVRTMGGGMEEKLDRPEWIQKLKKSQPGKHTSPAGDKLHTTSVMTAQCGTVQWMAPELCAEALNTAEKISRVDQDPRGKVAALESFRKFKSEHRQAH